MKGNENKPHIGIFGRRNVGKSTLINLLAGQEISIVNDTPGTTTDPVKKTVEISGIGPLVLIDTAGVDDEGELGLLRVEKSYAVLPSCDLAIVLFWEKDFGAVERDIISRCQQSEVPFVLISAIEHPLSREDFAAIAQEFSEPLLLSFPSPDRRTVEDLLRRHLPQSAYKTSSLLGDTIKAGDTVVLVTPIDASAPEGRMILPQVQVLRDILDHDARAFFCKETDLAATLLSLKEPPALVVTDSQVFSIVASIVPPEVRLTSFSMVLARAKGPFADYVKGTPAIDSLADGDKVLILESCSHDITCEDIGRVKLPALLKKRTGKSLECTVVAGLSPIPADISGYKLVIQCGGCVITSRQLQGRLQPAINAGIPVTNYGLALAYLNGIFHRAIDGLAPRR